MVGLLLRMLDMFRVEVAVRCVKVLRWMLCVFAGKVDVLTVEMDAVCVCC